MQRLTAALCLTVALLLGSAGMSWSDGETKFHLLDSNFIQTVKDQGGVAKQAVRIRFLNPIDEHQKGNKTEGTASTGGALEEDDNNTSNALNETILGSEEEESEYEFLTHVENEEEEDSEPSAYLE